MNAEPLRYLALGDSYTLGTGATSRKKSFPTLLARSLARQAGRLVEVENLGADGSTADDLIRAQLPAVSSFRPHATTVLIGANDIAQGRSQSDYRDSIQWIYAALAELRRVAAISIPDWSLTPAAARFGPTEQIRQRIEAFNTIAREEAAGHDFQWLDITEVSRRAGEPGWTSADGLHPADAQYAGWAAAMWAQLEPAWAGLGRG